MAKTIEELQDAGELCDYCPLDEDHRGVHCYGGEPIMCEGCRCEEAYEAYLEEGVEEDESIDAEQHNEEESGNM